MRIPLLAAVLLAGCAGPSTPSSPAAPAVYHATLANGLRVVLCEDDTVPMLAMKLSFRVTWRDEPPGQEGIRFLGLASVTDLPGLTERVEQVGGWWDPTNHYPEVRSQDIVLSPRDLPLGVGVFREMLESTTTGSARAAELFRKERGDYLQYMRAQAAPDPLDAAGFAEPFAHNDPSGVKEALNSLTEEEFLAFRGRHFAPTRAEVTLVGAFHPAEALALLKRELGGLPNPPEAIPQPQVFRRFLPGRRRWNGSAPTLRVGYPVPAAVPALTMKAVSLALREALTEVPELKACQVRTDTRPGQRLLRIECPGASKTLLPLVDKRLDTFVADLDEARTRRAADKVHQLMAVGPPTRFGNVYWLSWALAFEAEPLAWEWRNPWTELGRLATLKPGALQSAAASILVPARRLVLAEDVEAAEETTGEAVVGPPAFPFPDEPPPAEPSAPGPSYLNPRVRRLAGGSLFFLESPARPWFSVAGILPRGTLDRDTAAYVERLEKTHPEGAEKKEERTLALQAGGDALVLKFQGPCQDAGALLEQIRKIQAWLGQAPASGPGWTWMVCGPGPAEGLEAAFRPEPRTPVAAVLVRPAAPAFLVRIPLGRPRDAESRAAVRLLTRWLTPEVRTQQRYGPFTLDLPKIEPAPEDVSLPRDAAGDSLILRFPSGNPQECLAWLKAGAGTSTLTQGPMDHLRGHALASLLGDFGGSPGDALLAAVMAPWEGGADARIYDEEESALRTMTPERFQAVIRSWLEGAALPEGP